MRMRQVGSVTLIVAMGLGSTALAADGGTVERPGEAQIKNGDKVEAKKRAIADALRQCIEYVVGVTVTSKMSQEAQETVKNNQNEFYQQVRDAVEQKSEGFIQKYDVLTEDLQGDVLKVKIRAVVFESKIKAEVQKLADLIAAAGNPKLMLVVQEVYQEPDGSRHVGREAILSAYLEKELLARGFELRGQNMARQVAGGSAEAYEKWQQDMNGAMQAARSEGADILITGRVEIKNQGKIEDTGGMDALKDQFRVELSCVVRGLNTSSGEVFSSKPTQMKSMGLSVERAVHRAFQGTGHNLVAQVFGGLLEDLKASFKKAASQGQQYVVQLNGVSSYRKQGQRFLDLLKSIQGVSAVAQQSFDQGNLIVDVACKCSPAELQQRIFNATETADSLNSMDISGISGKRLVFKL
jgi:hypothetical protein